MSLAEREATVGTFVLDAQHWLFKLSPDEWIRAGLAELRRAEEAYQANNPRGGFAGAKRAAGMALNGALIVEPNELWARTYVEHIRALAGDPHVPERVRAACHELLDTPMPGQARLVALRTPSSTTRVLEAARDIIAHAYAVLKRHEGKS